MPLRIVPCYFHAVAHRWIACQRWETKRANGFFVVRGDEPVDFAGTRAEAEAAIEKLYRKAA